MHRNNPRPLLGRHIGHTRLNIALPVVFIGGAVVWALALIELWRIATTHRL